MERKGTDVQTGVVTRGVPEGLRGAVGAANWQRRGLLRGRWGWRGDPWGSGLKGL